MNNYNQSKMHDYTKKIKKIINTSKLINKYYSLKPDPYYHEQRIKFGTSGYRGSSEYYTFNENHILAISQAIVYERTRQGIHGPCYVGYDTHALSEPAFISVLEVLSGNKINIIIAGNDTYTPTPFISHAILNHNRHIAEMYAKSDGIILTSSHNPPEDGGIKYYSHYGGIANIEITNSIEKLANLLLNNLRNIQRLTLNQAWHSGYIHIIDFGQKYIINLDKIVNMRLIKQSNLKLGVDPMGGSGIVYWQRIAQFYKLNLVITSEVLDKTFQFLHEDYDGVIRMDCSSKLVMQNTLKLANKFDLIFSNDPDCDRHGVITSLGLINPNHYLAIVADYLFQNRPLWKKKTIGIGKTLVTSTIINKVAKKLNHSVIEVPTGFKWFVQLLHYGLIGFAGEESSGGIFLKFNRSLWSSDKDGIVMCLLAAEITANTNKILQKYYKELTQNFDISSYHRTQIPFHHSNNREFFNMLISQQLNLNEISGDPIIHKIIITNNKTKTNINGIKLITNNGWIAFRVSGTEKIYKIYSESFISDNHRQNMENVIHAMLLKY